MREPPACVVSRIRECEMLTKLTKWSWMGLFCVTLGCGGSSAPILPTGELTEEQKAKIRAEDKAIENEESQGSVGK